MMILDVCVPTVISLAGDSEDGSSYELKLFCNSLQLTQEDATASDEMKKDAAKNFRDLNCTLDDACAICYLEEGVSTYEGLGEEVQEYRPVPCNTPLSCPVTTTTTVSANPRGYSNGNSNGNRERKKRQEGFPQGEGDGGPPPLPTQPGGGEEGEDPSPPPPPHGGGQGGGGGVGGYSAISMDLKNEAKFIDQFMKVPQRYRCYCHTERLKTLPLLFCYQERTWPPHGNTAESAFQNRHHWILDSLYFQGKTFDIFYYLVIINMYFNGQL